MYRLIFAERRQKNRRGGGGGGEGGQSQGCNSGENESCAPLLRPCVSPPLGFVIFISLHAIGVRSFPKNEQAATCGCFFRVFYTSGFPPVDIFNFSLFLLFSFFLIFWDFFALKVGLVYFF